MREVGGTVGGVSEESSNLPMKNLISLLEKVQSTVYAIRSTLAVRTRVDSRQ